MFPHPPPQRPRSRRNRDKRVVRHLPLVRSIANRMCARVPQVEIDDLVSAGAVGLIEAADRYDEKRGVPFASFAYSRIRGAIIDVIRRLAASSNRFPGDAHSEPLSLEAPILAESNLTLMDVTVDPLAAEPQQAAELSDLFEAIRHLPRREREMLGRSAAGHTLAEIADFYGCSESRASQLLVQARFRLEERTAA
jgi:RNA polymerase sigma factor for flagellar operon FliA